MSNKKFWNTKDKLIKRDGYLCGICGKPLYGHLSIDHLVARVNGGSNKMENLRVVHHICNTDKNKSFDQPLETQKDEV